MLLFLAPFLLLLQQAFAYAVSNECIDPGFVVLGINIPAAVDEALSIAEYGGWRLQTNQPAVGQVLQQLLGNDGNAKSMFINRMAAVPAAFGPYSGPFNPLTMLDHTVVIKCKPTTLTPVFHIPNGNILGWKDDDFPIMPMISGADDPCNPNIVAIMYMTGYSRTQNLAGTALLGPSHVIMLCSVAPGQAMYCRNTIGKDWAQRRWDGQSFDVIGQYLPPTLLHEALHVAGPFHSQATVPATLPSGRSEMYQWSGIVTSNRNDDKQANADGYSTLASGS
ncbi:hypothetical protein M409DRAFT_58548 [Zasmidium cellare ATCC 36951]|uniref:Lysine-specific metallo-endopeptidase domain-containing protein n=1 Tax=Zasmidium cellare ATCC 36951 TaxID=1080233 RepID=A0A6A6C893_ZASCE|nr:uncharacterized protein M409DRAFT_58548 [Zasmidium cellare ATCC 36951]KAF2162102.1 hypothetical protein M409DRAFT_58548 [Zasmidium cellare ATCC 36951]